MPGNGVYPEYEPRENIGYTHTRLSADEEDSTCLPAQQALVLSLGIQFKELDIIIISFQYPFVSTAYSWNGHRIIPLDGRNKGKINRLKTWLRAWQVLKRINREKTIIGLLSFWCTECALIGQRFGKKYQVPHYTWILGQDARKQNKFVPFIRPDARSLIAMSPFLSETFLKNHGIRPAHMIPNGISSSAFPTENAKRDIDFLGVGSLIPLKQFDIFIRTIKNLKKTFPGISAVICGKGPEEQELREMILDQDLQNNISIVGELPHHDILQWMNRSKLLLHPSVYEGFSTVCLEALYAGANVISFCDPMTGKIPHWHIVKDEREMADLALKLLQNGNLSHERVMVYGMSESARQIMALYQSSDNGAWRQDKDF